MNVFDTVLEQSFSHREGNKILSARPPPKACSHEVSKLCSVSVCPVDQFTEPPKEPLMIGEEVAPAMRSRRRQENRIAGEWYPSVGVGVLGACHREGAAVTIGETFKFRFLVCARFLAVEKNRQV